MVSQSWAATAEPESEEGFFIFCQRFVMLLLHHRIDEERRGAERREGRRVSLVGVVSLQWSLFVLPLLLHTDTPSLSLSLPPASVRLSLLLTPCLFLSLFPSRRWMIPGAPLSKIQNTNLATSDEECSHCTASQDLHSPLLAASASAK